MDAICKISNIKTTWPCPARVCPLFGDCIVEYEKKEEEHQRKEAIRQHLGKAIMDFCYRTGHYPAAILAEPEAFIALLSDRECVFNIQPGEYRWGTHGIPLRKISSGERGVYLIDWLEPVLVLPKEG